MSQSFESQFLLDVLVLKFTAMYCLKSSRENFNGGILVNQGDLAILY